MEIDNFCGVSKKDIYSYVEMLDALKTVSDDSVGEYKKDLSKYGGDVRSIQLSMRNHISGCFLCGEYYKEVVDLIDNEKLILPSISDVPTRGILVKKREWGVEHSSYKNPEDLRTYLFGKVLSHVRNRIFELKPEFEDHIKDCQSCQVRYNLELEIDKDIKRRFH